MKQLFRWMVPVTLLALAGCVVAPARGYYYGPRAVVVAPAPAVVVHPYGWYRYCAASRTATASIWATP